MKTHIINAHIISPDVEIPSGSIEITDGLITAVKAQDIPEGTPDTIIDAQNRMVFPGFIDIHAHGADCHDVCNNTAEQIPHIARRKLQEGVTTWLPTTLTQPQDKLLEIAQKCADYRVDEPYCKTPGLHVEGPFINVKKAGAQNPQYVRKPNVAEVEAIAAICPVKLISIAPDVEGACAAIEKLSEMGIVCSGAHTEASAAEVREAMASGLQHLTHFGNAMTGLHHREIGCVGAGLLESGLKVEMICDGIHLDPAFVQLVFTLKPIDKILMITDSMEGSWLNNGTCYLGGLEVEVVDKVARLKDGGALAGSALVFNEGVRIVREITDLPLSEIVKTTSWNQAQSLGLEKTGKIEEGFYGDIAILNEDFSVWKTLVNGEDRLDGDYAGA